jgi:hypothetical protein
MLQASCNVPYNIKDIQSDKSMRIARKMKSGLVVALLPLLFYSCVSVSTIPMEVMRPAAYSVPPDILSVVVVDFSFPFRGDSTHVLTISGNSTVVDTIWVDDFGLRVAESMAFELDNRAFFDSVFLHPVSLNRPPAGRPDLPLSPYQIEKILETNNAQAVIALESVEYRSRFQGAIVGEFYYASLDANSRLLWKIYDAQGQTLDAYIQQDSIFWDNSDAMNASDFNAIPGIRYAMESLADFMGKFYPDRIAPYWESQRRSYYSGGHHLFSRANDLLRANNWEHAARVWYFVFDEGNKRQKAMAAFNIALSFEVAGDFVEAAAWAEVSKNLFDEMSPFRVSSLDKVRSIMYTEELNERIRETQKLEEQVGAGI